MLGEQIYEHKGKVIGQRILDVSEEAGLPKIETTFSASGHNQLIINDLDLPVSDKQYCEFFQQLEPAKVREQQFVLERITEYFKEI
jgi:hypothetical protein